MPGLKLVLGLTVSLAVAGGAAVVARSGGEVGHASWAVLPALQQSASAIFALVGPGYDVLAQGFVRAPAVVAGAAAVFSVPLLAVLVVVLRRTRRAAAVGLKRRVPASQARDLPRLAKVWVDVDGPRRLRVRLAGEMLRIGGDEDNDLRLEGAGVQRYHAVIQRTPDAEFILLDVSDAKGRGTIVNGRRQSRVQLNDGDQIQFGRTRVTFHFEPISHTVHA
jgi:hypothetical protein